MNIQDIRIDAIQIEEHHRKDHGDLESHARCIETEGLLKPIGVTPDNQLIWGHRTLLACRDILGWKTISANVIDVPSIAHGRFIEWAYSKELAASEMVALIDAVRSFEHGGDRRSDQARKSGDVSTKEACKRVGISDDTFYRAKQVCEEGSPKLKEAMDKGLVSINQAHKLLELPADIVRECVERLPSATAGERRAVAKTARRIERERRKQELLRRPILIPSSDEMIQLHHCRFQELAEASGLKEASAQAIITDIPYGKDFLDQLDDLAAFAERYLADGGVFATHTGKEFLPQLVEAMGKRLNWLWMLDSHYSNEGCDLFRTDAEGNKFRIFCKTKHILVYTKGVPTAIESFIDLLPHAAKEKEWDNWQQPLAEVEYLVSKFTRPGDVVIDPCGGGFTTGVACLRHFRRFVGCDVQQQWVANGQERVDKTRAELIRELEIHLTDATDLGRPMNAALLFNEWAKLENVSPFVAKQIVNQLPDDVRDLLDNDSASAA
ncbi:MAG: DNA methyltransferase [Planctomycetaceae bacterium]